MRALTTLACAVVAWASWAAAVGHLTAFPGVEVRRVHASRVETYLDLRVHGRQHLIDVALAPNARGEWLVAWFVPDLPRERRRRQPY